MLCREVQRIFSKILKTHCFTLSSFHISSFEMGEQKLKPLLQRWIPHDKVEWYTLFPQSADHNPPNEAH